VTTCCSIYSGRRHAVCNVRLLEGCRREHPLVLRGRARHGVTLSRTLQQRFQRRSRERLPDHQWNATVHRVRGEFEEMPCLRVTLNQARMLFGLPDRVCAWVLGRLEADGFLGRTPQGEYVRQTTTP
jgi:hypothetical protein